MEKITLTDEQKARIDNFAKLKKECDIITKSVDKEKEALLAELGLGVFVTDNTILSFAEQLRHTTKWKQIAEENIEPEVLEQLIPENTTETPVISCRTTSRN